MLCQNCNRSIEEGTEICPHCNAKIDKKAIRCPNCWTKHDQGTEICYRCGCNIPETIKENEENANYKAPTLWQRIKGLPPLLKVSVSTTVIAFAAMAVFLGITTHIENKAHVATLAKNYIAMTDSAVDSITVIAQHYENDVYNKDWITHIETARELRQKYAADIEMIEITREPVGYSRDRIKEIASKRVCELADDVYYGYVECYSYVIGENGKYPHYLNNYKKLTEKFHLAVKALEEEVYD